MINPNLSPSNHEMPNPETAFLLHNLVDKVVELNPDEFKFDGATGEELITLTDIGKDGAWLTRPPYVEEGLEFKTAGLTEISGAPAWGINIFTGEACSEGYAQIQYLAGDHPIGVPEYPSVFHVNYFLRAEGPPIREEITMGDPYGLNTYPTDRREATEEECRGVAIDLQRSIVQFERENIPVWDPAGKLQ